jgi:hypothetical protein
MDHFLQSKFRAEFHAGAGTRAAAGGGSQGLSTILSNVASGGAGGAILMAVIGLIKSAPAKNS